MKMKTILIGCVLSITGIAFGENTSPGSHVPEVVIRATLVSKDSCDKYCWYTVKINEIMIGKDKLAGINKLSVAAYSTDPGIPSGESILNLERYDGKKLTRWKLLKGRAAHGVIPVKKPRPQPMELKK